MPRRSTRVAAPVGGLEAAEQYLGQEHAGQIGEIGREEMEVLDKPAPQDAIENEAFMNETMEVMVHDSTDENAIDLVMVGVNGVTQYFKRGQPQTCKRKFVERLARAKETAYSQNLDAMNEGMNFMRQRHSLKYPFSVIRDPNPSGAAWLKRVLAESQ